MFREVCKPSALRWLARPANCSGISHVNDQAISRQRQALPQALEHLRFALQLLDGAAAPAEIGAHVDLAASQLELTIGEAQEGFESTSYRDECRSPMIG